MMKKLIIYTDGACRGNPGPAGIGIVICNEAGKIIKEDKEFIGNATNNIAEYRALVKALELANDFSVTRVECFSDSELMVRQLNGVYRVKNEKFVLVNLMIHTSSFYSFKTKYPSLIALPEYSVNRCLYCVTSD